MRLYKNAYRDMGSEKMRNLTVRVDEDTFRGIEDAAEDEKVDRSTATRRLLEAGLADYRRRKALDAYRGGACTLWKAAQDAGLSIREMMRLAEAEKIPVHITPVDVDEAWRKAHEK
jgi:metal-responsive CopG/Arc/MetJ family transcriptional regulator